MEIASNFQTVSFGPRISRPHFNYVGRIDFREHIMLAHSNINRVQINHLFASPFQMQCNAVYADRSKLGSECFHGNHDFDAKSGTFSKFSLLSLKILNKYDFPLKVYAVSCMALYRCLLACRCRRNKILNFIFIWLLWRTAPFRQGLHSHSLRPCRVTSGDSGGTLSGDNILLNEETLARDLKIAIKEENYAQAAKIRDSLRLLQEDSKTAVLAANARFYNSFKKGDLAAMQTLWSKDENVCVVHPGVSGIAGYDLVMGSWEFVWAEYDFPLDIEIRDVQVHVRGDIGYVTCVEMVKTKGSSWGKQFATNVFEKIDGQWFMCIHHASYIDL